MRMQKTRKQKCAAEGEQAQRKQQSEVMKPCGQAAAGWPE